MQGPARIVDGDTLVIGAVTVRLEGIDAPETDQLCLAGSVVAECGRSATEHLQALALDDVTCIWAEEDRYGRALGTCSSNGISLNAAMVAHGHALAFRRYSHAYIPAEEAAESARAGIWATSFIAPWDWRAGQRLASGGTTGDCAIKGNISASGARIFHEPGSPSYAATRINEAAGERWFCTVEDALAAGWRAPRG
ncbi:MAG: thermonuclease family protein [Rubricella sp.]